MRFPLEGPKRVAFLAKLHDEEVRDLAVHWAGMVAQGWDPVQAREALAEWAVCRAYAVCADFESWVARQDAA